MGTKLDTLIGAAKGKRYRFTTLLAFLFALFLMYPIILELPDRLMLLGTICIDTLTAAVLLASVNIAGGLHRLRRVLLIIAIPVIALTAASYISTHESDEFALINTMIVLSMHALVILFLSIMMLTILRHVLEGGRVTLDEINGAVCVYLLMGLAGAYLYAVIEYLNPGSFSTTYAESAGMMMRQRETFPMLLYYSLVTLTTLGYGDITPLTPLTRTLSSMQAVFGQVYLAVLVARLVGTHIAHVQRSKNP